MILKYLFRQKRVVFFIMNMIFFFIKADVNSIEKEYIQKPLVVVTCMYNNADWVLYNLQSIFMQQYENFRVIIVDDGSQDETAAIIESYIQANNLYDKVTFISNKKRRRKLANLYHVLYLCKDDEIVLMLDGDDWFAHPKVFQVINETYSNQDVWFTYGQYYNIPPEEAIKWGYSPKGYATPMPEDQQANHDYRSGPFRFMHLRTFYGWLFKIVKLKDLLSEKVIGFKGAPFPASNDLAMYYPMIETAHYKICFISEILYMRNLFSEIVGFKVDRKIQREAAKEIRRKKHYPIVTKPVYRNLEQYLQKPIAVVVLCEKDTEMLEDFFCSFTKTDSGIRQLYLLSHYAIDPQLVETLKEKFGVTLIPFHYTQEKSLSKVMQELLNDFSYEHVLFVTTHYQKNSFLNFQDAVYWLEKTYARAFYTGFQTFPVSEQSWIVPLNDLIYGWKTLFAKGMWRTASPLDGVLYRTVDAIKILGDYTAKTISQLTLLFKKDLYADQSNVNLAYY